MSEAVLLKTENRIKSAKAEAKVMAALSAMLETGEKVSFYSVAKKTGVSRNFLYTNTKLRNAITDLRDKNSDKEVVDTEKLKTLDSTLLYFENVRQKEEILRLQEKIAELEKRVRILDTCLMALDREKPLEKVSKKEDFEPEIVAPF